ncbi:luciferase family oxidoreductase group 1 [Microbacteriaceae bacterium SG_E_30_P1]|uniref:Luciferase family oxidoreductase group 1 n=1 Tax=Antiquaquibacter oligotrophicus TaxID=2880260 RepID=A0ABT6KMK6_9MICO|nr:LLM class flavin-dependent oxidoreductase [Antiquaquibacter oligotrophicus]MDH6181243.1 luciferase family oxidoreductase group 1 [Antiquaquibacter oligotrophicus]UDF13062.1 LLM class flavin-dependent oxidoreductase [Antiquaquibacter oligotrophicus]
MTVPLSVLDLASVYEGMSHTQALRDTIATAQEAERLGFRRIWVAEHHGMPAVASSAPAVLIGAIADATSTIRVGSGGVMLPNHSSLVIAEQFGTLVALHGDRIDLGLGRAPGTDGLTAAVLRRAAQESVDDFPNQVIELLAWFGTIPPLDNGIGSRIVAVPGLGDSPELWLLGSSDFSARLAGLMGLPFAFAHHFAGGAHTRVAFEIYRENFTPSVVLREPHSMVAVAGLVAETGDEAERLALPNGLLFVRMRKGERPGRIPTLAEAESYPWTDEERTWVRERNSHQAIGDIDHVKGRIASLVTETGADEVIIAPQGPDLQTKLATLRAVVG